MPIEQADNTRVERRIIEPTRPVPPEVQEQLRQRRMQEALQQNPAQLWDADKVKRYQNMQNFYNNNFFGYGIAGRQTNYDPRTPQGQAAIQANFNYAKGNAEGFMMDVATAGLTRGANQAIRWATTPVEIGRGAEAIVRSSPVSRLVQKTTVIPRREMHARNSVPGALKSRYVGTSNGLNTYTQPKVRILSKDQIAKAQKSLEKLMSKYGWRKITHPNLDGIGFTNGRSVVSDLGVGNIGRDWLGRVRLTDFSLETVPAFRAAMRKHGGRLFNKN